MGKCCVHILFGFLMKTNLWALWDTIFIIEQCVWVFSVFFVGEKWGGVKWEKVKERESLLLRVRETLSSITYAFLGLSSDIFHK